MGEFITYKEVIVIFKDSFITIGGMFLKGIYDNWYYFALCLVLLYLKKFLGGKRKKKRRNIK